MKPWIVVLIVVAEGCGGAPFEAPLFDDAGGSGGEGGGAWASSSAAGSSGQQSSSSSGSTSGSYGGSTGTYVGGSSSSTSTGSSGSTSSASSGSGGSGGSDPCGPANCAGCCDDAGECQVGDLDAACGAGGEACDACASECGWDYPGPEACATGQGTGEAWFSCQAHACMPEFKVWPDGQVESGKCCGGFGEGPVLPCVVATGKCPP